MALYRPFVFILIFALTPLQLWANPWQKYAVTQVAELDHLLATAVSWDPVVEKAAKLVESLEKAGNRPLADAVYKAAAELAENAGPAPYFHFSMKVPAKRNAKTRLSPNRQAVLAQIARAILSGSQSRINATLAKVQATWPSVKKSAKGYDPKRADHAFVSIRQKMVQGELPAVVALIAIYRGTNKLPPHPTLAAFWLQILTNLDQTKAATASGATKNASVDPIKSRWMACNREATIQQANAPKLSPVHMRTTRPLMETASSRALSYAAQHGIRKAFITYQAGLLQRNWTGLKLVKGYLKRMGGDFSEDSIKKIGYGNTARNICDIERMIDKKMKADGVKRTPK